MVHPSEVRISWSSRAEVTAKVFAEAYFDGLLGSAAVRHAAEPSDVAEGAARG